MAKNPYQMDDDRDRFDDEQAAQDQATFDDTPNVARRAAPKAGSGASSCVKWGCGCSLLFIIVFIGGCGSLAYWGFQELKQSTPIRKALDVAGSHPEVQKQLGVPLEMTWIFSGSMNFENDDGHANVEIPVAGPKGAGVIHVHGEKRDGEWIFTKMACVVDGSGQVIDFLIAIDEDAEHAGAADDSAEEDAEEVDHAGTDE